MVFTAAFSVAVCFFARVPPAPARAAVDSGSMGGMEKLKAAWSKGKEWAGVARSNPARTMKLLSAVSGALLIIGGISGVINIFNPLGIVISIYNM